MRKVYRLITTTTCPQSSGHVGPPYLDHGESVTAHCAPDACSRQTCAPLRHSHDAPLYSGGKCRDPGSSRGPSDLQSDAVPTELSRLCFKFEAQSITEENNGKRVSFIGKQWRCHHGAAVSLLAHVSAITFGTRDICLPFFIRRVFPDPSSPLNPNSVREHVQIPEFGSRLLFS